MKYLKKFNEEFGQEEFNAWAKSEISKHINFKMIRDIKDMSLEYLDENLLLKISVLCPFLITKKSRRNSKKTVTNVISNTIYTIEFSHTKNVEHQKELDSIDNDSILDTISNLSIIDFTYTIELSKDFDERDEEIVDGELRYVAKLDYDDYIVKTRELSKWIKEVYPNEKIVSL